ncbi:TfoX/Sxy family protein [Neisseria dentiae]|uniref:TfoX/Sxy family protein n=1 Tax=Neisseria dentiae TaxID=194197 RepID=UPI0035A1420E
MNPVNDLSKLRNLGAKSAKMLAKTGICTAQDLRQLGAVQAYLRVIESGSKPSLNLLWAIECALTDRDWRDIA